MVVVDFSYLFYRFIFAQKDAVIENPKYTAHLLLNELFNISNKFQITNENKLIVALDSVARKNTWRFDFYKEQSKKWPEYEGMTYKGNRVKDVTFPWHHISPIYDDVIKVLKEATDVQVLQHPKAEADDIIFVVVKENEKLDKESIIVSSDKDFKQLINEKTRMFDSLKRQYVEIDDPKALLEKDILTGQKRKDNILPVRKGIGEKRAETLRHNLDFEFELDPKLKEKYLFNKILIDLSEIPTWIYEDIVESMQEPYDNYDFGRMLEFCQKYGLRKIVERIDTLQSKGGSLYEIIR